MTERHLVVINTVLFSLFVLRTLRCVFPFPVSLCHCCSLYYKAISILLSLKLLFFFLQLSAGFCKDRLPCLFAMSRSVNICHSCNAQNVFLVPETNVSLEIFLLLQKSTSLLKQGSWLSSIYSMLLGNLQKELVKCIM